MYIPLSYKKLLVAPVLIISFWHFWALFINIYNVGQFWNLNLYDFQHFHNSQIWKEKMFFFLNKGSGALQKARQMQKKPHILSLENWTSFQFFWENEKQSCFVHISYLNLVFYYQLNIKSQVNANACRFPSLWWKKKYHVQTGLVLHVIKCTAWVKWSCSEEPFYSPRWEADEYLCGTVPWASSHWKGTLVHNGLLCPLHSLLQFQPQQFGLISAQLKFSKKIQ